MNLYVTQGYVECGYFVDDCTAQKIEKVKEYVKVFGFSKTVVLDSSGEAKSEKIRRGFRKASTRKAVAFPEQSLK